MSKCEYPDFWSCPFNSPQYCKFTKCVTEGTNKSDKIIELAKANGRLYKVAGLSKSDNPNEAGTPAYVAWEQGHDIGIKKGRK